MLRDGNNGAQPRVVLFRMKGSSVPEGQGMDPAHAASTNSGYDGSQLLQGIVPQSMPPYSLKQWMHGQPVRGYGSEYIGGTLFQESPGPARSNVGGGSSWLPTSVVPSWVRS
jgi:hypothetical protein